MKIAILILAHKNPNQLQKLVNVLKSDFEVFIHFDKKASISTFFQNEDHVHILKKRYNTNWGSYKIVLAEIELLKAALAQQCDYFMLISGQDIPIMSNRELISNITANYTDYIEHHRLPVHFWGKHGGKERLQYYWSNDAGKEDIKSLLSNTFFYIIRHIQMLLHLNRKVDFKVFGGSQWLNLTKASVEYILNFLSNNKWYIDRFKYTRAPDELFFQTLLLSFDYNRKKFIVNNHKRYFDWVSGPEYPKILRSEDHSKVIASEAYFARKFDENIDVEIINKLLSDAS